MAKEDRVGVTFFWSAEGALYEIDPWARFHVKGGQND